MKLIWNPKVILVHFNLASSVAQWYVYHLDLSELKSWDIYEIKRKNPIDFISLIFLSFFRSVIAVETLVTVKGPSGWTTTLIVMEKDSPELMDRWKWQLMSQLTANATHVDLKLYWVEWVNYIISSLNPYQRYAMEV